MKLRTLVKISIITSVALLCTGIAVFFYFKLSAAERKEDFELYSLVPLSATGILETDNMTALIQDIDELNCSKDNHFLYLSKILSRLKLHFHTILEETPHGLSRQMNKVLLSFHEPDNDRNQVLYCAFGPGDHELIGTLIKKYCTNVLPYKLFEYKGEEIRIYLLPDGNYLSCYYTPDFLVASYQKRLIEEVIDARLSKESLLADSVFADMHAMKKNNVAATVYTHMGSHSAGAECAENVRPRISLGGWTEYDIKLSGDAIYFTGINHDTDTCQTLVNRLCRQQSVEGFPGEQLPASTFFFSRCSVSDWQAALDHSASGQDTDTVNADTACVYDDALLGYLKEVAETDITTCHFACNDTTGQPAVVASFPVINAIRAEQLLKTLMNNVIQAKRNSAVPPITFCYTSSKAYPLYLLPCNRLFAQLTGRVSSSMHTYACLYNGCLLLAPDAESLTCYIRYLEKGEVLERVSGYKESVSGLSEMYKYMLVSDLEYAFASPEKYVRLLPDFFFRYPDFFRYFVLSAQITCTDGTLYPNVVLLYKGG